MRTHLLQNARPVLVAVILAGWQETSTDPRIQGTGAQSIPTRSIVSPTISKTAGPPLRFQFVITGNFGDVSWSEGPDASGNTLTGNVSVSDSDDPGNLGAVLSYSVVRCDVSGSCSLIEGGFGPIPRSDVISSGGGGLNIKELRLTTNTSTNPDFFITSGVGGPISVEWQKVPGFVFRFKGVSQEQIAESLHVTQHGTSIFYTAKVRGSVVGVAIPAAQAGQIGRNENKEVAIFR